LHLHLEGNEMTQPLSPAAQAKKAFTDAACGETYQIEKGLAAAILDVADQVVPDGPRPTADSRYHLHHWTELMDKYYQRQQTRAELLAIAAELEGQPPTQPTREQP
jgi:hypothetical protein